MLLDLLQCCLSTCDCIISITGMDLEASSTTTTLPSNPQLWPHTSQNGEGNVAAGAQWPGFTPDLDGS